MAEINKKLVKYATEAKFEEHLTGLADKINPKSVVFIENTGRIWTHGKYYDGAWAGISGKPSTYTPSAHTHGLITNDGKIGTSANRIIETTTGGSLTHVAKNTAYNRVFGTGVDQVAMGNHTHPNFTRTVAGLVPAPGAATTTRYLREDGTWVIPPNTADTHWVTGVYVGAVTAKTDTTVTNPYIKIFDNDTNRGNVQIIGGTNVTVSSNNSKAITINSSFTNTEYLTNTLAHLNAGTDTVGKLQTVKNLHEWLSGKGYATESYVDNIEIGGRNLVLRSAKLYNGATYFAGYGDGGKKIDNGYEIYNYGGFGVAVDLESSAKYVMSFDVEATGDINGSNTKFRLIYNGAQISLINKRGGRYSFIFTSAAQKPTTEYIGWTWVDYTTNRNMRVTNIKLEKGNKATDWTPAPEDQVSDWNTTDVTSFSYIKNKPTQLSQFTDNIGVGTHIANKANPHAVTTAQIGAVDLTTNQSIGGIKSFTSDLKSTGSFIFETTLSSNYKEGVRFNRSSGGWGAAVFGGVRGSVDGISEAWWLARNPDKNFVITYGTSGGSGGLELPNSGNNIKWRNQLIYHAGNIPTWNQSTTGNAATASAVSTSAENSNATSRYILFADNVSGNQALKTNTGLKYVPSTNTITATLAGNASSATTAGSTPDWSGQTYNTTVLTNPLYILGTRGTQWQRVNLSDFSLSGHTHTLSQVLSAGNDVANNIIISGGGTSHYFERNFKFNDAAGGWARGGFKMHTEYSVESPFTIGMLGSGSSYTYSYLGFEGYDSSKNLRIYPSGTVSATTFSGNLTGNVTGSITGSAGSTANWAGNTYANSDITNEVYLMTSTNGTGWRRTLANRYVDTTSNQSIGGVKNFTSNVGIGTTAPSQRFHIEASGAKFLLTDSNITDVNNNSLLIGATQSNPARWELSLTNRLGSSATSYLTLLSGNVGIGTTSPAYKLDVTGTGRFTGDVTAPTFSGNASSATCLLPNYVWGVKSNPQTYFNNTVGLKVAMTGVAGSWSDTLWINGYSGGDVKNMIALHTSRQATPRMWISSQDNTGSTYGTLYEFLTSNNSSVSGNTIKINGTSTTWVNTHRGIVDNLTSQNNKTESLNAHQGYLLANGSARDSTKLPLSGGTMTGNTVVNNYGIGNVGLYSPTRYQNVFSMGAAYIPSADGTSLGNMYGIAWTHTNVGGQSKAGLSYQALFVAAGVTQTAIGTGIWTVGTVTAPTFIGNLTGNASSSTIAESLVPNLDANWTELWALSSTNRIGNNVTPSTSFYGVATKYIAPTRHFSFFGAGVENAWVGLHNGDAWFRGAITATSFLGKATSSGDSDKLGGKLPSDYILDSEFASLIDLINGIVI